MNRVQGSVVSISSMDSVIVTFIVSIMVTVAQIIKTFAVSSINSRKDRSRKKHNLRGSTSIDHLNAFPSLILLFYLKRTT